MKRMHIHVAVENLNQSIAFYNALFGSQPEKVKEDYAKWMLEDPKINFAISTIAGSGIDHLGIQVESSEELDEIRDRMSKADMEIFDEGEAVCCYARSNKSWVKDPVGVAWEAYHSMEDVQVYSEPTKKQSEVESDKDSSVCCISDKKQEQGSACCG